jgi:hypothetical protein
MINDPVKFPNVVISSFAPFRNKEGKYVPGVIAKNAVLYEELEKFQNGYYSIIVKELRDITEKKSRSNFKTQNFPAFTFSCCFYEGGYRKQDNIHSYTNILCIDVDDVGLATFLSQKRAERNRYDIEDFRDEIANDIPCIFAGLSCSGKGVFFLVKYNEGEHNDCFGDIEDYMLQKYRVNIDASCKDYARLRFATYDKNAIINAWDETKVYEIREEYRERKKRDEELRQREVSRKRIVLNGDDAIHKIVNQAVNMIFNANLGERHNKIRAASRLLGGYVGSGIIEERDCREVLEDAVINSGYDDIKDARNAIDYGINSGKLDPIEINIITPDDPDFEYYAEQEEKRQREIKELYREILGYIRTGVGAENIDIKELCERYLIDTERVRNVIKRLYVKFANEFNIRNKPVIARVEQYFRNKYFFRRDAITENIEARVHGSNRWFTVKSENLYRDICNQGFRFKFDDLNRLLRSDYVDEINPWREHFESIKLPDPEHDYIGELADYITCLENKEQDYFKVMFKKMLVRTIKGSLDDHYANRTVFVLASQVQSNGKSTFIRWLNPFGPHRYYAENPLEDNKDARIRLAETFIYNLEELATSSKTEINRLKAIISQIGSRDRKPYGRQAENIVRRCSFFGSTNNIAFLTDDINTRWLCFEIKRLDWNYTSLNKDYVWAQAYRLYKQGYDCELSFEEANLRDKKNERFSVITIEEDLLRRYFDAAAADVPGALFLTSTSIHEKLLIMTKESRITVSSIWIGRALSKLKFQRVREKGVFGYWVVPKNQGLYSNVSQDLPKKNDEPPY